MEPVLNEYFSRKIDKDLFLVTTRCGTYALLSEKEYRALNNGQYRQNKNWTKKLVENKILLDTQNTKDVIALTGMQYMQNKSIFMNCIVNLTHRCNLGCLYCHANAGTREEENLDMDDRTIETYLDFILNLPHKNITIEFQGGEPLLRFDKIKYILEEFNKRKKKYNKTLASATIVSNLTLMNLEIADYILENNIGLSSSLDGPRELHDAQRSFIDGRGSYDAVVKWCDYFEKRKRTVGTMPTITKKSIDVGARAIIDEYIKLGRNGIYLRAVNELGRGKKNTYLTPGKKEFADFLKDSFEYCVFLFNEKKYMMADRNITTFIKNIIFPVKRYMCMRMPCGAAMTQVSITPNGDIYPCDIARSIPELKVGNIKTTTFSQIVMDTLDLRTRTQEFQPLCDTCAYNNFCGNCAVMTYATYGSFVAKTPGDFDCYVNKVILDYLFKRLNDKKYIDYFKAILKTEE